MIRNDKMIKIMKMIKKHCVRWPSTSLICMKMENAIPVLRSCIKCDPNGERRLIMCKLSVP